ncbi:MAG TPA: rod-binding protein [Halanaerobiales bacterium]|nr:rod-binding protein [Halanaerobiales bacterium]
MIIDNNYNNTNMGKSFFQDRIYQNEISSLEKINNKTGYKELNGPGMDNSENEKLRLLAGEFTSILLKQMFKSMRNTIFKSELLDGGFAEEVFTDMLDEEISKKGASQQGFNNLSRILYEQLKNEVQQNEWND